MTLLDEVISGASGEAGVATLLRQVKILASRTGAEPLADWVHDELAGYPEDAELPAYRGPFPVHVLGHFMGGFGSQMLNVQIPSSSFDKKLEANDLFEIRFRQPIAEIESMAAQEDGGVTIAWNANLVTVYNQGLRNGLIQPIVTGDMLLAEAKIPVSSHLLAGVLDAVRNGILDLALRLEKIVPDAGQTSTSDAEQDFAALIINNHFHASSNVAIAGTNVRQSIKPPAKGDVEGLVHFLREMGLLPGLLAELQVAAKADEEDHLEGPGRWKRVRAWFARVATETGTEAIGGAIATAAVGFLGG